MGWNKYLEKLNVVSRNKFLQINREGLQKYEEAQPKEENLGYLKWGACYYNRAFTKLHLITSYHLKSILLYLLKHL